MRGDYHGACTRFITGVHDNVYAAFSVGRCGEEMQEGGTGRALRSGVVADSDVVGGGLSDRRSRA